MYRLRRTLLVFKEYGILGSIIASGIVSIFGLLLSKAGTYIGVLSQPISISLSTSVLIGIPLTISGVLVGLYKIVTNQARIYGKVHGYYRTSYNKEYYPYMIDNRNVFFTHHIINNSYLVCEYGLTKIGPITISAYRPHSTSGLEEINDLEVNTTVNGEGGVLACELTQIAPDEIRLELRSKTPLNRGDRVKLKITYNQPGLNALCQEELTEYLADPNLKQSIRNRLIKETNCELVAAAPGFSSHYQISIHFPEKYPWKLPEHALDVAKISVSAKPLTRETLKKIIHFSVDCKSIIITYRPRFHSGHTYYLFWRLPTRSELKKSGFLA